MNNDDRQPDETGPMPAQAQGDPVVRQQLYAVAVAGLSERDERLLSIVLRHQPDAQRQFRKVDLAGLSGQGPAPDIVIVNPFASEGIKALARVRTIDETLPTVHLVPQGASARARFTIHRERLTLQLLQRLSEVAETVLEPARSRPISALSRDVGLEPAKARPDARPVPPFPVSLELPDSLELPSLPGPPDSPVPADPVEPVTLANPGPPPPTGLPQPVASQTRRLTRVLLIGTSAQSASNIERAFAGLGSSSLRCARAENRRQALEHLDYETCQLVMIEKSLTGSSGFKLAREVRRRYPELVVVMLANRFSLLDVLRARLAGCASVLAGPVSPARLKAAVRRPLRQARDRQSIWLAAQGSQAAVWGQTAWLDTGVGR